MSGKSKSPGVAALRQSQSGDRLESKLESRVIDQRQRAPERVHAKVNVTPTGGKKHEATTTYFEQ